MHRRDRDLNDGLYLDDARWPPSRGHYAEPPTAGASPPHGLVAADPALVDRIVDAAADVASLSDRGEFSEGALLGSLCDPSHWRFPGFGSAAVVEQAWTAAQATGRVENVGGGWFVLQSRDANLQLRPKTIVEMERGSFASSETSKNRAHQESLLIEFVVQTLRKQGVNSVRYTHIMGAMDSPQREQLLGRRYAEMFKNAEDVKDTLARAVENGSLRVAGKVDGIDLLYSLGSSSSTNAPSSSVAPPPVVSNPANPRYTKFKTVLCSHFLDRGRCPAGDRCTFAHGAHELRAVRDDTTNVQRAAAERPASAAAAVDYPVPPHENILATADSADFAPPPPRVFGRPPAIDDDEADQFNAGIRPVAAAGSMVAVSAEETGTAMDHL